ncbi:MAG: tRNA lysidine(34) synthetase TilS [bacterium]|nr:tRNA lysidine(34) synthetase TilS [bacterium]
MKNKVINTSEKFGLFSFGDKITVALSGGADSVCLLHILYSIKEKYSLSLSAAHLNHNLRGEESLRDRDFVVELCKSLDVPLYLEEKDVESLAKINKQSVELCARNCRYDFFRRLHKKYGVTVATAHTASDNLETMLYNIARGTSLNGMKGIVAKRNYIIRPLIEATRAEVERYCRENDLAFVNDSTNQSNDYTRNKIRHFAVPILKEINPNAELSASQLSEDFLELDSFLEKYIGNILKNARQTVNGETIYNAEILSSLGDFEKKQAVFRIFRDSGIKNICRKQIEICCQMLPVGGETELNKRQKAVCRQGLFRIVENKYSVSELSRSLPVPFTGDLSFKYDGFEISAELCEKSDRNTVSGDLIKKNAVFRTREQGDFIILPKRNVKKSLKKFMIEEKIPREQRDSLVLLACGKEIMWLQGYGASKTAQSFDKSSKMFRIQAKSIEK